MDNGNAGAAWVFARAAPAGSWVLPSSAFRGGVNGAEFHTDVRILNLGTSAVTVTAMLYDQASGTTVSASGFSVAGRSQASYDNVLQSLFGKTLANGSYGPIRFDSTGPITVSSSVNNVNACGTGATSGQWLPGIHTTDTMTAGAIAQLAVSTSTSTGYRTNLVVMNPGSASATATIKVRAGGGVLLSTGTIGPLGPNGFSQVALDNADIFPGVAGRTDTNLWVEFTSNQPVLAFASVINNASGDPFAVVATPDSGGGASGSWVLPSSAFRGGVNGAEFHTDVRILNLGSSAVTVAATLYDQASGTTVSASGFPVAGRSQASFDNVLQSLFGKTLANGSYGPIRFDSTGPITVSSSVNNVNACGTGATSGQWLPGIPTPDTMTAGAIAQLAVSMSSSAGYRTNLVVMNPGSASATATVKVRTGGGVLLSTGTIGPLGPNGFSQVALDNADIFPGVAGRTDTNLWVEFTSNQPVLAFASVINNASGDPFAVVATPDSGGGASSNEVTVTLPGGVPLVMVKISAGTFQMGALASERGTSSPEQPQHQATLTSDYYMGKYLVTQGQWQAVMGTNPSYFSSCGNSCPVEQVSWSDIRGTGGFIEKLNAYLTSTGQVGAGKFRLPTEAEWERAARGGTQTRFSFGDALECDDACGACASADPYVWWCGNSGSTSHPVGTKQANPYGLFDMHGNLWEWCEDWYGAYGSSAQTNPTGPTTGSSRVFRGGYWTYNLRGARSAFRNYGDPDLRNYGIGFRLARSL